MRRTAVFAAVSVLALSTAAIAPAAWSQDRGQTRAQVNPAAAAVERPARVISFAAQAPEGGILILPLSSEADLETRGDLLDAATRAAVARALATAEFRYGASGALTLRGLGDRDQIIVVGLPANAGVAGQHALGERIGRTLATLGGAAQSAPVTVAVGGLSVDGAVEIATGIGIGGYVFERYRTPADGWRAPGAVTLVGVDGQAAFAGRGQARIAAMALARDLSNEPANVVYPETFVERARAAFAGVAGVEITVLDEPQMARLGMGALLSVGQGSQRPSRLIAVRYRGPGASGPPIALVGKGITFDSGGISIKPSGNMGNMKMDMSGAANVVATVLALARQGAPVDVVAVAALAENMPSGSATRPGDVVRAMNGTTIEIISTDAEGRMVLADAVTWADTTLNPAAIVDIATLTGAIGAALGPDYAGLFSRQDALAAQLEAASAVSGEGLWRMPLNPVYASRLRPVTGALQNSGAGPGAGTGAYFIGTFVRPQTPWAHLDIAGVAYSGSAAPTGPAGSKGFGVRLLERFVLDFQPVAAASGSGAEAEDGVD